MKAVLALVLLLGLCSPGHADQPFIEISGSDDSDDATLLETLAGYRHTPGENNGMVLELAGGRRLYSEGNANERFSVGRLQVQSSRKSSSQFQLRTSFLNGRNWSPILAIATLSTPAGENWHFEASAERDIVDSLAAVRNETLVDSYTLSADYQLNHEWVLVGAALTQHFSDSNRREGGIGRIIYSPASWPGFHLQLKARQLLADQDSPDYFSPRKLKDGFFLLGYATPFAQENFHIKILAGPGRQQITTFGNEEQTKSTYLAEVSLRGWLVERWQINTRVGCTSADETSADYRYCYAKASIGYQF